MSAPPSWNLWARFRAWERENRAKAQILGVAAVSIGFIVLMFLVTIVIVFRTLR